MRRPFSHEVSPTSTTPDKSLIRTRCLDNLHNTLLAVIQNIERHTGLIMHCFLGGPDARDDGQLKVFQ